MKAIIHTLGQVLYSPSQYVIPVFQRNYRWELPQWQRLWDSLEDIQQPDKTGNHFMGFLVYVVGGTPQPGQNTRFHLIDGQQRLTTLSLLLAAIRNVARRLGDDELGQEIHDDYLVHPRRKGEQHHRLLPKEHDQAAWIAIVSGKPSLPGRMAQAVAFFERVLAARAGEASPAILRRAFEAVCQRLDFMGATLESENAYSIFKSLNSTGVPLSQADLIRNFVFMHVRPDEQDAFDSELWRPLEARFSGDGRLDEDAFARFFRDLLMSEGQYVPPRLTFATFEARHEATGFDPGALAASLALRADQYAVIASRAPDRDPDVTRALVRLNRFESSTTWPLLLWLFAARERGDLDDVRLAAAANMLCGFILRRFVCGESSRGYGEMFVRAVRDSSGEPLAALEQFLLQRGWPDDARFIESFVRFPLYKRGYAREVLEALEVARGHKEPVSLKRAQIEHVLPQTLSDEWADELGEDAEELHAHWLHQPGNLTLSAYNQEVGNQPFAVKRARFAQSNIELTKEVAACQSWSETEIQERGERLAREAVALWSGPQEPYAAETPDSVQEQEARGFRLAFWTGFADHVSNHHPALPAVTPLAKRTLRLRSRVPQVVLALRFKVQDGSVAVVLKFHRRARVVWEQLRKEPEHANGWVGQEWTFREAQGAASMVLDCPGSSQGNGYWLAQYDWLASKLSLLYAQVLPWLRERLGEGDGEDEDDEAKPLTATRRRQLEFWTQLVAGVMDRSDVVRPQKPAAQGWINVSIGRSGFGIVPTLNQRIGRLGVEVMVAGRTPKEHFHALLAQKETIERELGFPLEWLELPDAHQSRIVSWRNDSPLQEEERWDEYVAWMADRIVRMDAAFRQRIRALG